MRISASRARHRNTRLGIEFQPPQSAILADHFDVVEELSGLPPQSHVDDPAAIFLFCHAENFAKRIRFATFPGAARVILIVIAVIVVVIVIVVVSAAWPRVAAAAWPRVAATAWPRVAATAAAASRISAAATIAIFRQGKPRRGQETQQDNQEFAPVDHRSHAAG
jgi:hypothetical protein